MKLTTQVKLAFRIAILMVGLIVTIIAARGQVVSVADGGPILVCPPGDQHCQINLPPQVADGGPILVCPPGQAGKTCQINLPAQVADGGPILVCPPGDKNCPINLPPVEVADGGPILVCPPGQAGKTCQINLPR
jgi:hypothetical protein